MGWWRGVVTSIRQIKQSKRRDQGQTGKYRMKEVCRELFWHVINYLYVSDVAFIDVKYFTACFLIYQRRNANFKQMNY